MTLLIDNDSCALACGRYEDELAAVRNVGALIFDPPYGKRVHDGHDKNAADQTVDGGARSRPLSYGCWTPDDVRACVKRWSPVTDGWFCAMSCSDLAPVWRDELEAAGRVGFAPIPCVMWGSTVRQQGDGPSSWTCYLNVARPRGREYMGKKQPRGGTKRGAYIGPPREGGHIGGKPLWLMAAIVRDYAFPGQLVCDPTAGYGTTGVAALGLRHTFIGCELDRATADSAAGELARDDHALRVADAVARFAAWNEKRGIPAEVYALPEQEAT